MRISDWSSDVCSSDLVLVWGFARPAVAAFIDLESRHRAAIEREGRVKAKVQLLGRTPAKSVAAAIDAVAIDQYLAQSAGEIGLKIGTASWRERVCQYV